MSTTTSIEWTDVTWNPVRGCALVSEGCRNCYAMKVAHRFSGAGKPYDGLTEIGPAGPRWTGRARTVPDALREPLSWRKPRRVFVNSMSDLFHEDVPDAFIDQVFAVMALARRHTFQVLTKRPERMRAYVASRNGWGCGVWFAAEKLKPAPPPQHWYHATRTFTWPLPNVWLGVSAENQATADERIPLLLQTPAAVRFVSAEPLLGPIDLEDVPLPAPGAAFYGLRGVAQPLSQKDAEPDDWKYWTRRQARLDWVIVGGESGPHARPCAVEWIERIVDRCRAAGIAPFVKQLGAYVVSEDRAAADEAEMRDVLGSKAKWPEHRWFWRAGLTDPKGGDLAQGLDEAYRVREFPIVHPASA